MRRAWTVKQEVAEWMEHSVIGPIEHLPWLTGAGRFQGKGDRQHTVVSLGGTTSTETLLKALFPLCGSHRGKPELQGFLGSIVDHGWRCGAGERRWHSIQTKYGGGRRVLPGSLEVGSYGNSHPVSCLMWSSISPLSLNMKNSAVNLLTGWRTCFSWYRQTSLPCYQDGKKWVRDGGWMRDVNEWWQNRAKNGHGPLSCLPDRKKGEVSVFMMVSGITWLK